MKTSHAALLAAGFALFATGAFADDTKKAPRDAGSGSVAEQTGKPSPLANPTVKGDKSTIQGDKRATTQQRTGSE